MSDDEFFAMLDARAGPKPWHVKMAAGLEISYVRAKADETLEQMHAEREREMRRRWLKARRDAGFQRFITHAADGIRMARNDVEFQRFMEPATGKPKRGRRKVAE